jgi:hypothetical protein
LESRIGGLWKDLLSQRRLVDQLSEANGCASLVSALDNLLAQCLTVNSRGIATQSIRQIYTNVALSLANTSYRPLGLMVRSSANHAVFTYYKTHGAWFLFSPFPQHQPNKTLVRTNLGRN